MKKIQMIVAALMLVGASGAAAQTDQDASKYRYVDATTLPVFGKAVKNTADPFSRLPLSMKETAREAEWNLGLNSAGLYIRFTSDSPVLDFKWTTRESKTGDNMSAICKRGLSLYVLEGKTWVYAGTARPQRKDKEGNYACKLETDRISGTMQEYMLYLGLYDEIRKLLIGIPEKSRLEASTKNTPREEKPVIMYGTSILQGASASHPGLCSTNLLGRMLDRQVINLGFSGNALLDYDVAELIAKSPDPGAIVFDFCPNGGPGVTREKCEKFFRIIRDAHPDVPIVFVECPTYPNVKFSARRLKAVTERNAALKEVYDKLRKSGEKKLYYVEGDKLLRKDNVGTIECTHFTDIGFEEYCKQLFPVLKKCLR